MSTLKFRPSARIIHTIGDHIIKDIYAAVVELVKNSYDADAKKVTVEFLDFIDPVRAKIVIRDNGYGMSRDDVLNKWLVPGTDNKSNIRKSIEDREIQGRKGIGRFAAAILGDRFILETTNSQGETTVVKLNWSDFNAKKFLDEIELDITTDKTNLGVGTEIVIKPAEKIKNWDKDTIDRLIEEFSRMLSPTESKKEDFSILFRAKNMNIKEYDDFSLQIKPFPILDNFDYRLYGEADEQGNVDLTYINGVDENIPAEQIFFRSDLTNGRLNAPIKIDLRVFDRDPEAIESIISRGKLALDKKQTKMLLDKLCGISIFRNGFRIRPYGDSGYDWLDLDKKRVQDPSHKIGVNQIVGMIEIENEEDSKLFEKSARDGLKENSNYAILKKTILEIITNLEQKRYSYREKTGRGRKTKNLSKELEEIFDLSRIKESIKSEFKENNISDKAMQKIQEIIEVEEKEKSKSLEDIKETITMYQGQVTVGKIISVLMHEGRKPLKYLNEGSDNLSQVMNQLRKSYSHDLVDKVIERLGGTREQALLLIDLFDRLNPLSVKKKGSKKENNLLEIINQSLRLFQGELQDNNISCEVDVDKDICFYGWGRDLLVALTNLFLNSIYWLSNVKFDRKISIKANVEADKVFIDFIDNGPGINKMYIEKELIFEPGFSTKPEGTGLGLAISGEAIERNNGILEAIFKEGGSHFRIELPIKMSKKDER
jgi:nitrogen-specific signal transduction histidine kinase